MVSPCLNAEVSSVSSGGARRTNGRFKRSSDPKPLPTHWQRSACVHGGSMPPRLNGLQRQIRHRPFNDPQTAPYFCTAWMKYVLHDGSNRQTFPYSGLIAICQPRTSTTRTLAGSRPIDRTRSPIKAILRLFRRPVDSPVQLSGQLHQRMADLLIIADRPFPRPNDQIQANGHFVLLFPKRFPQAAFPSIPLNGIAHPTADRKPQSRPAEIIGNALDHQCSVRRKIFTAVNAIKFGLASQTILLGEALILIRQNSARPLQ